MIDSQIGESHNNNNNDNIDDYKDDNNNVVKKNELEFELQDYPQNSNNYRFSKNGRGVEEDYTHFVPRNLISNNFWYSVRSLIKYNVACSAGLAIYLFGRSYLRGSTPLLVVFTVIGLDSPTFIESFIRGLTTMLVISIICVLQIISIAIVKYGIASDDPVIYNTWNGCFVAFFLCIVSYMHSKTKIFYFIFGVIFLFNVTPAYSFKTTLKNFI
eukprot:Pgem_evm1s17756